MKHLFKFCTSLVAATLLLVACDKVDDLPTYANGEAVALSISAATIAPAPFDSNKTVLNLSWTSPRYAQDSALYKYVIEIDSAGRNFSKAVRKTYTGVLSGSYTAKELNDIALGFGFSFNVAYDMDIRVVSSYGNNNEPYRSNTVKLKYTPYKVPPKVPVPPALYIVGDINGYNNSPGLDPKYRFSQIDETTYAGIFNFTAGGNYKLIQTLGEWSTQFHMIAGGTALAGQFEQKDADPGFINPSTPGWYRVTVDFQTGTYKVAPSPERVAPPADLYIVGDLNGYNNSPSLDPKYKFSTTALPYIYTLDVDFPGGGAYKLIQQLGNWSTQFHMISGGTSAFGEFEQKDSDPGFAAPAVAGRYRIKIDFASNYYWVTKL